MKKITGGSQYQKNGKTHYQRNKKKYNLLRQKRKYESGITKKILMPQDGRSKVKGYEKIFKQKYFKF